jgi:ATP-binding cassette subfamily B protein
VIRNPDILILDEATSSLDVETEAAIQESLAQLTKGRTTIAIAHRLSTLRAANRLIVLEKGRVAEVGTHMELMKQKGIYYKLVIAQRQISSTTEEK